MKIFVKVFVVSLGGSLIVKDNLNIEFLKKFKRFIEYQISKHQRKFIIVCGGGKIARKYQRAAKSFNYISNDDLDWLGIYATKLNAYFVYTLFKKYAYPKIIDNPTKKLNFKEKILIAAGWKPGFSTDYDVVMLAKNYKAKVIFNLTNIDYVYDKNPKEYKDAKIIKKISWQDYLKTINQKWEPGMSVPFDPVASRLAKKLKLKCYVLNGQNLKEFQKALDGKEFKGTIIY